MVLEPSEIQHLHIFGQAIEPHLDGIIEQFSCLVASDPQLAPIIDGKEHSLKQTMSKHLRKLLSGVWDEDFTSSMRRIGHMHSRAGVQPSWYVDSYRYILNVFVDQAIRIFADAPDHLPLILKAINTAIMHDMDLALSAYHNAHLKVAFDNMPLGLVQTDSAGCMSVCNDKFRELFNLKQSDLEMDATFLKILCQSPLLNLREKSKGARKIARILTAKAPRTGLYKLTDGKFISISHAPLADGGSVDTFTDISQQVKSHQHLAFMTSHDQLTQLPNATSFRRILEANLGRAKIAPRCALLYIDIDNFKLIRTQFGENFSNTVLRQVARILQGCACKTDAVARLGADEFAILETGTANPNHTAVLAERVLEALRAPIDIEGTQVRVAVSIGVVLGERHGKDIDRLLRFANLALDQARLDGGNSYCFFDPEMDMLRQEREELEDDLRNALSNGELELRYHPIVAIEDFRIDGFEALVRWRHPKRGELPPTTFIPIAEETGLIDDLGAWVIETACRFAAQLPDAIRVAVNVSVNQFNSQRFFEIIRDALEKSGLEPGRLEIEVTESILIVDIGHAVSLLHQIQALGVTIALDDFGTGYSSLSYIRQFPFDKIKIDQSFVGDMCWEEGARAIVQAVLRICQSLGVSATAEGVKSEEQLQMLRLLGCTHAQGYLFSEPYPASAIPAFLESFPPRDRKVAHFAT